MRPESDPPAEGSRARSEPELADTLSLARGAQQGDELYQRIAPSLFTWAEIRIRADLRGWLDPQDVVQEVWCRAWRLFPDFDPERVSFRYWVFRVAKNVLLEALRKVSDPAFRASQAGSTTRLIALHDVPDSATGISRRVAKREGLDRFAEWVKDELDDEDRKVLLHCGLEGLSHAEASERLQVSREALSKRWQRLRRRLEERKVPRDLYAALE